MLSDHFNPIALTFSDCDLEKAFLEEYRQSSIKSVLSWVLWACFIVVSGFFVIIAVLPGLEKFEVLIAYGIVAFPAIYLHFRYFPPSSRLIEIDFVLLAILPGWLYSSGFLIEQSPFQKYIYAMVAVHIVASSLALPVRFLTAAIGQIVMIFGFSFTALFLSKLTVGDAILQSLFLHGIIAFCLYAVYQREKASRENFLKQKTISSYSNAFQTELEKGRKIQKDFLPTRIPQVQNCDIATYFHPALQLSGDFYDVFTLPDNRVGLVIADVSDKGVGSALFMALVRSFIRFISGHSQPHCSEDNLKEKPIALKDFSESNITDPMDALNAVSLTNEYIAHEHGEEGMFATLFFGVIDPSSGQLSYINGGHEPLIIVGAGGINKRLKPTGPAVGMMPGSNYKIGKAQFEHGDILFGYTDGVTEARSPADELYTRKRLEKSIVNSSLATVTDFSESIKSDLFKFIEDAPQSDDITMLALRWSG